jgi:hypothetical protein
MVGIVSSFNLPSLSSIFNQDPYVTICQVVIANQASTIDALKDLKTALATGDGSKQFPLTYAYLGNQANQALLVGNQQTCISFFNGLQKQFQADLVNNKQSVTNEKQTLIQFLQKNFPKLTAALG